MQNMKSTVHFIPFCLSLFGGLLPHTLMAEIYLFKLLTSYKI